MIKYNSTPIEIRQGKFPHTGWLDLSGKGVWTEVAIMAVDNNGNVHFFPLTALDRIDRQRFFNIISNRNANQFPLYELCSQTTLGNGINALTYFQQLVKVLTPTLQILTPRVGQIGGSVAAAVPMQPAV